MFCSVTCIHPVHPPARIELGSASSEREKIPPFAVCQCRMLSWCQWVTAFYSLERNGKGSGCKFCGIFSDVSCLLELCFSFIVIVVRLWTGEKTEFLRMSELGLSVFLPPTLLLDCLSGYFTSILCRLFISMWILHVTESELIYYWACPLCFDW